MKYPIITITALNLLLAAAMPVMADDHSDVDRREEINARLDQRGQNINDRMDRRVQRAADNGNDKLAARENIRQSREAYRLQRR